MTMTGKITVVLATAALLAAAPVWAGNKLVP